MRQAIGGSKTGKNAHAWVRALEEKRVAAEATRRGFKEAFRNRRFWAGVYDLHAYCALALRDQPQFERVALVQHTAIQTLLTSGRFESPLMESLKKGITGIVNTANHDLSQTFRESCSPLELATVYKIRKMFLKDESNALVGAQQALERFLVPPTPLSSDAGYALDLFAESLLKFCQDASDETKKRWKRGYVDHQGGAGVFTTRATGGRAAEMHLIVGLYRLSLGKTTTLIDVFGTLSTDDDLYTILDQVKAEDDHLAEIQAACYWYIEQSRDWPESMYAIFPAREPKMRAFLLRDYARQFVARQILPPLREFLMGQAFCKAAFIGQWLTAGSDYDPICEQAAKHDLVQVFADARAATDNFQFDVSRAIISPLADFVPIRAFNACVSLLQPTLLSATTKRPKYDVVASLHATGHVFNTSYGTIAALRVVAHSSAPLAFTEASRMPRLYPERVPNVRIGRHLLRIVDSLKQHRITLLKAETGSGKTVLFCSLSDPIVQFSSVAALKLMQGSLRYFGIPCTTFYSLEKEDPVEGSCILCTASFVPILARKYPSRMVVLDEAETPREDFILNLNYCRTWSNVTVIMSATPNALTLTMPHNFLDLHAPSPHVVSEFVCNVQEMLEIARAADQSEKILIVVHSEPQCRSLAAQIPGSIALVASVRAGDFVQLCETARVIISTSVVRNSVTLPGLTMVFDYQIKYVELDFASQGFKSLHVVSVNADEIRQLKGRVGRVADGAYVVVKHDIPTQPNPGMPCERFPSIAQYLEKGGSVSDLAQPVCEASVLVERVTLRLVRKVFHVEPRTLVPLFVTVGRTLPEHARFGVALVALEESGLLSRTLGMKRSEVPEEQLAFHAVSLLREASEIQYPERVEEVIRTLYGVPAFYTQMRVVLKWILATSGDADPIEEELMPDLDVALPDEILSTGTVDFAQPDLQLFLVCFFWRNIAVKRGKAYTGLYRDFSTSATAQDPEYALLLGLTMRDNALRYATSITLSRDMAEVPQHMMEEEEFVCQLPSGDAELYYAVEESIGWGIDAEEEIRRDIVDQPYAKLSSISGLVCRRARREVRGRASVGVNIEFAPLSRTTNVTPDALPLILQEMRHFQESICEIPPEYTKRGMPMSWILSFPILNSVNLAAYMYTVNEFPRFRAVGFGDDLAGAGSLEACRTMMRVREELGLLTNEHATGIFQPEDCDTRHNYLGVFCEVLYEPSTGEKIFPPKPRALLALAKALAPDEFACREKSYLPDVRDIHRVMQTTNASLLRHLRVSEQPNLEAPVRSTYPRTLLRAAFLHAFNGTEPILAQRDAKRFLSEIEPFILAAAPSTKGQPDRRAPGGSFPPLLIGAHTTQLLRSQLEQTTGKKFEYSESFADSALESYLGHYPTEEDYAEFGVSQKARSRMYMTKVRRASEVVIE